MNRIKILSVDPIVYEKTAKGGYSHFTVHYDQGTGKPWKRKLVSFVKPDVAYQVLKNAQKDEQYDVDAVKDEQGNWQWPNVTPVNQDIPAEAAKPLGGAMKSTYETPEERAYKQKVIIRQSSLTTALEILKLNGEPVTAEELFNKAEGLEAWVTR